jgi:hypothetical protein
MGITQLSLTRINNHIQPDSKILILGCQNLYNAENYLEVAHPYFESLGHLVRSWDITGCQDSEVVDLRDDLKLTNEYDIIFQHGTIEHCDGNLWQVFKNIHEACKIGGIMMHENPMTMNWPGHGYHYFTQQFYHQLAKDCGYEILELTEEPAMSNDIDGWNVSCVLLKTSDKFCSFKKFGKYELLAK